MKFNFRKVTAIATSVLMTGMTVGTAMAAGLAPADIGTASEIAIVYGTGVGVSALDQTQALSIETHLKTQMGATTGAVTAGTVKLTEDEVVLGTAITATGKIPSTIKQNKLSTLKKEKMSWDDGTSSGSQEYDIHEEIVVGTMNVLTTLDDEKLNGVALSNENGITYKVVFEDALNVSQVGTASADTFYLDIMGKEYEVANMTATTVTVTTSTEKSMTVGEKFTLSNGKSVTLTDVYSTNVEISVDGTTKVVSTGSTVRVNGVRVRVESIGYHENTPETSKAILKIGEDIDKQYTDGDEYIGQDSDDPLWVWDISTLGSANGYIGVTYNAKINSANDEIAGDSIKYVGNGYTLPDNFAAVTLDSLTAAKYQDVKVYFEDSVDLFNNSSSSTALIENVPALVVEGDEMDTITVAGHETNKMYVYFNTTTGKVETYYNDVDGDFTPTGKMRLANAAALSVSDVTGAKTELATLSIGDTDLDVDMQVIAGIAYLNITNDDRNNDEVVKLTIGGTLINSTATTGTLESLGATVEDAEANDVKFNGTDVSTKDYDYMDTYGIYLAKGDTVEAQADADEIVLSVPEEQVYAQVSVSMGATATGSTGAMVFKDTEKASFANKNVVIVGGSCINAAAAEALGVAAGTCGSAFTAATNVASGQFLIKKTTLGGKNAVVVAGYEADDTVKAAQALINKGVMPGVYTTTTQEVVTA